jgi:hypothetical protein
MSDEYMTPSYLLDIALARLDPKKHFIWEPFRGDGHSTQHMKSRGFQVTNGDQWDFFQQKTPVAPEGMDMVMVTNPPFSKKIQLFQDIYKRRLRRCILLLPFASFFTKFFYEFREKQLETTELYLLPGVAYMVEGRETGPTAFTTAWFFFGDEFKRHPNDNKILVKFDILPRQMDKYKRPRRSGRTYQKTMLPNPKCFDALREYVKAKKVKIKITGIPLEAVETNKYSLKPLYDILLNPESTKYKLKTPPKEMEKILVVWPQGTDYFLSFVDYIERHCERRSYERIFLFLPSPALSTKRYIYEMNRLFIVHGFIEIPRCSLFNVVNQQYLTAKAPFGMVFLELELKHELKPFVQQPQQQIEQQEETKENETQRQMEIEV